jgi:transglutaminase-like putative cysteine protease
MKFTIHHVTTYTYSAPVRLNHHTLRFRPRFDGGQEPRKFKLSIQPKPSMISEFLNPEGNTITKVWFEEETSLLRVDAYMEVETLRHNPFDYFIDPPGAHLPMRYEEGLDSRLLPYLKRHDESDEVTRYAGEIADAVQGQTGPFLIELCERMHRDFIREIRETGDPLIPSETLAQGRGACRDLTVLFMDACRAVGLAARFVSGYQRASELERERRYLHAWPEVYLPGGGWRGYDPMHGKPVADQHVAIAAGAHPASAAPIEGSFSGPPEVTSQLRVEVQIQAE